MPGRLLLRITAGEGGNGPPSGGVGRLSAASELCLAESPAPAREWNAAWIHFHSGSCHFIVELPVRPAVPAARPSNAHVGRIHRRPGAIFPVTHPARRGDPERHREHHGHRRGGPPLAPIAGRI